MRAGGSIARTGGLSRALLSTTATRIVVPLACWITPLAIAIFLFVFAAKNGWLSDFRATIYEPGRAVLAGRSPYPPPELPVLVGHPTFVYPALLLWIDVPMAMLPLAVAAVVWRILLVAAVVAGLRLLKVRDWRCVALAALSLPVVYGDLLGNVSLFLVLGLALVWTYRDRPVPCGVTVGLIVGVKLLFWPLLVWLLATRRFRSLAISAGSCVIGVLGSWALIGFDGFTAYPHLLHLVSTKTAGPRALVLSKLVEAAGAPSALGHVVQYGVGAMLLIAAVAWARDVDGDRRAFSACVLAALVVSPVVWLHYFACLIVLIALVRPTWGPVWSVPWAFWLVVFVPAGRDFVVSSSGDAVGRFGVAPSPAKLGLVLALTSVAAAITLFQGRARRRALWTWPRIALSRTRLRSTAAQSRSPA